MSLKNNKYYFFITAIATVVVILVGVLIYFELKDYRLKQNEKEITSVAKARIDYLSSMYADELHDAEIIAANPALLEKISKWNADKSSKNEEDLIAFINQIINEQDYKNVFIITKKAEILLPINYSSVDKDVIIPAIKKAIDTNNTICTDLFFSRTDGKTHFMFVSPLPINNLLILYELDPEEAIFKPISNWPTPTETAEIYLSRIEGDSVTVLNDLRFLNKKAFKFKYSIKDTNSAVSKATKGFTGIVKAKDYRGNDIVAYVTKIPGTDWLFVAKKDVAEIFGEYKIELLLLAIFFILLISLLWLGFGLFYNYRQKSLFKNLWESQEEFKTTLYSIGDAVITTDTEGKIKHLNQVAEKLTGWTEAEAKGKQLTKVFNIVNEITRQRGENPVVKVLKSGLIVGLSNHTLLISKDGTEIPITDSAAPIKDKDGNILGVVLVFRDQIKERENQKLLRQSEESYHGLFNSVQEAIYIQDENGKFLDVNDGAVKMYGYDREYFIGKTPEFISAPGLNDLSKVAQCVNKAFNGETQQFEFWGLKKNGEIFPKDVRLYPGNYFDKKVVIAIAQDISERKKAERELHERERAYSALISKLPGFVYRRSNDKDWTIQFISNGCYSITGYKPEEFLHTKKISLQELFHPDYKNIIYKKWDEAIAEKGIFEFEYPIITYDGNIKWIWERGQGNFSDNGELLFIESFITDITERKNAIEKIEDSEKKLRSIFQALPDIFLILDYEGRYMEIMPSNEQLLYRPLKELIGKTLHEVFPKEIADKFLNLVRTTLETGKSASLDYELEIAGNKLWFFATTVPYQKDKVIYIARDITERKTAEQNLRISEQRLSAISALTSDYLFATSIDDDGISKSEWIAGAFEKMTGYTIEEYIALGGWRATIHPEDLKIDDEAFSKILMNQDVVCELRTIHKDGHIVWVRSYGHPLWNKEKNRLAGVVGAVKDITEEKKNNLIKDIQYNIAHALVSYKTIPDLFQIVRKELASIIDVKNFIIALYDERTGMLKADVDEDEMDKIEEWEAEGSLTGYVIKEGKSFLLDKAQIKQLINNGIIKQVGTVSEQWLAVPLKVNNKSIGAIVVQSYDNPKRYDDKALEILEVVANQLSLYIERKKIEDQTIKLSKAIEQSPSSIVITDIEGNIEYVNPKFTEITGYTYEEAIGKSPRILKSGKHSKKFYEQLWNTILSGKDWHGEFLNKKKSGELYWEDALISPITNDKNEITHFVAIKEDITEKKLMLEKVIESESRFRSIWESSLDGMRLLDENGLIVDVNDAYCNLVQMNADKLKGQLLNIVYEIKDSSQEAIQKYKNRFINRTVQKKFEVETNLWNGKKIWLELSNSFIEFPGKKTLLLSIFRDVTDKKQMIDDLIEARNKAEEMNRVKSFFFANMSHELRTPLVGILGFSEILKGELSNQPDLARIADLIYSSGQRLHETLNLILNVSKLEAGKLEVRIANVDIIPLIKTSYDLFSPFAKKKNLEYRFSTIKEKIICRVDPALFQNIINNLVNNAIKFTEHGSVFINVKIQNENALIQVGDTGVGISDDHQAIIWEEFRQSSEGISRSFEGTGLGLTIVKKYTELLGGKISLVSKVNKGSVFTVEFPIIDEKSELVRNDAEFAVSSVNTKNYENENYKILYVDDDEYSIDVVGIMLRDLYSLDFAKNADEAIKKVKTEKYDAILMDINLRTGLDGVQLTKLIRKMSEYKDVPIIALTAYAMEKEKQEFLSNGLSHYLSKPFRKKDLIELLNSIFVKN